MSAEMTFEGLLGSIEETTVHLSRQAKLAVNMSLTLRNWLIGGYIEEYERGGVDRAKYGDKLMESVAEGLFAKGLSRCDRGALYRYRSFYLAYPQIVATMPPHLVSGSFSAIVATLSPQSSTLETTDAKQLVTRLSYSHFEQLVRLGDPAKRRFYEQRCAEGTWSVRELHRQIASLYYERTALSSDKAALDRQTATQVAREVPSLDIRDPYVFEFLGLRSAEVMGESDLEDALLDRLQSFLLELGHGFCFEARQKRLLIGETHNFVDLVFYHRVLKCHVLIELKAGPFSHEHIGQLNTYVSWYAEHEKSEGDGLPIGLLLCTDKDQTVVKYALAGMSNQLFVSRYQVVLPSEAEIQGILAGTFE